MEVGTTVTLSVDTTATFGPITQDPAIGTWSVVATLAEGSNAIIATATDALGNTGTATATIIFELPFPVDEPNGCFIATAAFGMPMAEEVDILRSLRNEYLLTNELGQGIAQKILDLAKGKMKI